MFTLSLTQRDVTGKKVKALRKQGMVPAVVYGHHIECQNVMVPYNVFEKVLRDAGESSLIDASVGEGAPFKVLIHGVTRNGLTHRIAHADLYAVNMKEKIKTEVPLVLVGESKAVKEAGGIIIQNFDAIEIECLPEDLIPHLDVDISILDEIGSTVHAKDLSIPATIKIFLNEEDPIVSVAAPRTEEELKDLDTKVEENVDAVGMVEEKTKADDEQEESEGKEG